MEEVKAVRRERADGVRGPVADPVLSRLAAGTLIVPFHGDSAPGWLLGGIETGLGGVCLFAINGNVTRPERLTALCAALRDHGTPVICTDEEGGDVTRLAHATGSPYPGNAALGAVDDTDLTREVHLSLGTELATAGINLDFAPVADINATSANPVIGVRSFGADTALVARHTAAAVRGLQSAGVAACVKHFPGHGATRQDSHHELPTVDIDLDLLWRRELVPFGAAIQAGTQAIMTAHLRVPALTGDAPATLSAAALTGVLRERLGFTGVVVSDALEMRAISDTVGIAEGAVRSLAAGADLLCLGAAQRPEVVSAVQDAIIAAVRDGRLPADRLEEAGERVGRLHGWLTGAGGVRTAGGNQATGEVRPEGGNPMVGGVRPAAGGEVGLAAARRAIRVEGRLRPLSDPVVVEIEAPAMVAAGPVPWGFARWLPEAQIVRLVPGRAETWPRSVGATERSLVIVVRDAHRHARTRTLVSRLLAVRPDAVLVEMGLPVWRPEPPGCAAYVATYGAARVNAWAAAEALRTVQ